MNFLIPAALVAVATGVIVAVRRHWHYEEPADDKPAGPPPEMDAAKLAEALDALADDTGLRWRTSIVDLLKLLHLPSRWENREKLWQASGMPGQYRKTDNADQNIALHKAVFEKLRIGGLALPA